MAEFIVSTHEMNPLIKTGIKNDIDKYLSQMDNKNNLKLITKPKKIIKETEFYEGGKELDENIFAYNLQNNESISLLNESVATSNNNQKLADKEEKEVDNSNIKKDIEEEERKEKEKKDEEEKLALQKKEEEEKLEKEKREEEEKQAKIKEEERLAQLKKDEEERIEREKKDEEEKKKLENEKAEQERLEKEKQERLEKEKIEKENNERLNKENADRLEKERIEKAKLEEINSKNNDSNIITDTNVNDQKTDIAEEIKPLLDNKSNEANEEDKKKKMEEKIEKAKKAFSDFSSFFSGKLPKELETQINASKTDFSNYKQELSNLNFEEAYIKCDEHINSINKFFSDSDNAKFINNALYNKSINELKNHKQTSMSTKAFLLNKKQKYEESIKLDDEILKEFPNNHSSIARKMHSYMQLNNLDKANEEKSNLIKNFNKDIVEKYEEYTLLLELKNNKKKSHITENNDDRTDDFERESRNDYRRNESQAKSNSLLYIGISTVVLAISGYFAYKYLGTKNMKMK